MACKLTLGLFGLWLVANGLLIITNKLESKPIATFTRMASLTNTIVDVSGLRKYADLIYRVMGGLYLAVGVGCMHGCNFSLFLSFLLSVISICTFDNPLFSDTSGNEKKFSVLAHIIVCVTALSLCSCGSCLCGGPQCCGGKALAKEQPQEVKHEEKKDKNEQGEKKGKQKKSK